MPSLMATSLRWRTHSARTNDYPPKKYGKYPKLRWALFKFYLKLCMAVQMNSLLTWMRPLEKGLQINA